MFSKLLKHEFKSQAKLFCILSGVALAAGLLGGGMMRFLFQLGEAGPDSTAAAFGAIFAMLIIMASYFLVVGYITATQILLYYRFYKHHFSDEGYLTFTLPVSTHQILLSSVVSIAVWELICAVISLFACGMTMMPFFAFSFNEVGISPVDIWREVFAAFGEAFGSGFVFLYVFLLLSGLFGGIILPMVSITLGSVVAKKHKILASVGIYFGIMMILSTLMSIVTMIVTIGGIVVDAGTMEAVASLMMLIPAVLYLGVGIGGYFLMHHLVKNKLNLT